VAEHKIPKKSYNGYLGIKEAGKELILYTLGDKALAPLKKLYIGFGDTTVLGMINHLRLKTAIKITTAQKHETRTSEYNNPWDPPTSITAYLTQLNCFQVSLGNPGIATSKEEKTMSANNVEQRNVHRRPDGCMGKQDRGATNVGSTPDVLHQQVAGTETILRDNGKTIPLQGGSASHPRDSSSRRRGRIASNVIHNATGATRQTDHSNDSNKQGQHGCDDRPVECTGSRKRR
jgi:hypothetical protein